MTDALLLTPEQAAERLGIGRTKLYRLLATGQLRSVLIDSSRRITATALDDFVRQLDVGGQVVTRQHQHSRSAQ